jgi:hypothetical protein
VHLFLLFEIECISPGENVNQFFLVEISSSPAENRGVMTIISGGIHFHGGSLLVFPDGARQK